MKTQRTEKTTGFLQRYSVVQNGSCTVGHYCHYFQVLRHQSNLKVFVFFPEIRRDKSTAKSMLA